jgi:hypothetical protein
MKFYNAVYQTQKFVTLLQVPYAGPYLELVEFSLHPNIALLYYPF